jgi:TetR/AcrR family transcriptional regulator, regulator of cefoperazone and chloramphenicol sensitivity
MCSATTSESARETILAEAMRRFAGDGIAATSLREVAKGAGISPALVVHHYGSKEGLVAAVDEAAVGKFARAYADGDLAEGPELLRRRAEQTAAVMRAHPDVCAYLGRALIEGTPGSSGLFRLMIEGGRREIDRLAERGALREDADRLWATLQHFFLIWAPLSFRSLLEREALDGPLLEEGNLERWVEANVELLKGGLYRDE